jgi:hypothetical protein
VRLTISPPGGFTPIDAAGAANLPGRPLSLS